MSASSALTQRPVRRAGPIRRAIRRESARLRDRRRILAMALLVVVFALAIAGMLARGDTAGADAQAYWAAVRLWLDGGDPYHPTGPFLPYVYAPWMLPLFIPWAMLPWEVAWFAWRGASLLLLLWTIRWAYARRPLATAILVLILAIPTGANIDTGNVNLLLAVALFGAQFLDGRIGGLLWGLATWMKWVPAPLWLVLPARARGWGLAFLLLAALLSLIMLPLTIIQLQALFGFSHRPVRADYLVFVWSTVPWWWRRRDPFAFLRPSTWAVAWGRRRRWAAAWFGAFRRAPGPTSRLARERLRVATTALLGIGTATGGPGGPGAAASSTADAVRRRAEEIGD
jgi:Glycosyltransferase family 87